MPDSRNIQQNCRETICVDCNRIFDSCRDKDCFEDVRCYLTDFGQDIIEKASSVRAKCAEICGVNIDVEPVAFNRGFYQIRILFYVKAVFEACIAPGRPQEFDGLCCCEKRSVLYGSEGNVHVFRSSGAAEPCHTCSASMGNNLPVAVVETVDPVVLGCCVKEVCKCPCCGNEDFPEHVLNMLSGCLCECSGEREKYLSLSLGFFSVVRIERPGQYQLQATEYSVPDKVCPPEKDHDPCALFERMAFPVSEFSPPPFHGADGCGCQRK